MTLKKLGFVALTGLFLLSQTALAENDMLIYKNTRGSTLKLRMNPDNTLSGIFTTAVASKECPQAIGTDKPLLGYVANNAIVFSVSYPECGSIVGFTGNIEKNNSLIDVTAIIAHQTKDIGSEGPGARMISHDIFNQI
jgi:hypothetical protein